MFFPPFLTAFLSSQTCCHIVVQVAKSSQVLLDTLLDDRSDDSPCLDSPCLEVYTCIGHRFMFMFVKVFKKSKKQAKGFGCLVRPGLVVLLETALPWHVTIYREKKDVTFGRLPLMQITTQLI